MWLFEMAEVCAICLSKGKEEKEDWENENERLEDLGERNSFIESEDLINEWYLLAREGIIRNIIHLPKKINLS